ncbi:MAG: serine/threonine protein kinase [Kofleriaceae bacterium]|nr:serine/threonine protein kinase [Kofleriaceae bacterium]
MEGATIGTYRLVHKLGEGGMGEVWMGEHTLIGRRAAIKLLLPSLSTNPGVVQRFFNEARAVTAIADPGIVQVFDFGVHADTQAFIVMELLDGESLDARVRRVGRLSPLDAARLVRQVASSLSAVHAKGVIHRDLKPENLFIVGDPAVTGGERTKILDFGIAKLGGDELSKFKTRTGVMMGTPVYMSPEQCRGMASIDHRTDLYSLGAVLFAMVCGRPPFDGEGSGDVIIAQVRDPAPVPSSLVPTIPPELDAVILRCLEKDPAHRFQSADELAAALAAIEPALHGVPKLATAPGQFRAAGPSAPTIALGGGAPPAPGAHAPIPGAKITTLSTGSGQARTGEVHRAGRRWVGLVAGGAVALGLIGAGVAMLGVGDGDDEGPSQPAAATTPEQPTAGPGLPPAGPADAAPALATGPADAAAPVVATPIDAGAAPIATTTPSNPDAALRAGGADKKDRGGRRGGKDGGSRHGTTTTTAPDSGRIDRGD